MTRFATLVATALLASVSGSPAGDYQRPGLLVEPAALARPEPLSGFVVLDARPRAKDEAGHVPAARWVDHADWARSFGDGRDAAAWSKRVGGLGLTAGSRVVVYDDSQAKDAARVWWILRYWGVRDVRLPSGGWVGWATGEHPTERAGAVTRPGEFTAVAVAGRMATKGELLESLPGGTLQIVDARSAGEFCGTDALTNRRAGAIPGATQLEWVDLIDKDSHRFKSPDDLRTLFAAAGIRLDRPTATHCQSGGGPRSGPTRWS